MESRRNEPTPMGDASRPQQGFSDYPSHTGEDEINCQQFVELVTDYFEDVLSARTRNQVEEHLVMCDWCLTYAEQMQATVTMLNELGSEPAGAGPAAAEPLAAEPSPAVLAVLRERQERSP